MEALSLRLEFAIGKMYTQPLANLTKKLNIVISPADKTVGIVIMNRQRGTSTKLIHFLKT